MICKFSGIRISYFFILIALFISFTSFSQDPRYFVLGENEFRNADIYSILQTDDDQLYVATNQGLYWYQNGKMKPFKTAPGQEGTSIFNLVANNQNEVFCFNLNGQILRANNGSLELYYQIPADYYSEQISMEVSLQNNLIICSNGCLELTSEGVNEIYKPERYIGFIGLNKQPDGNINIAILRASFFYKVTANGIYKTWHNLPKKATYFPHYIYKFNGNYWTSRQIDEKISKKSRYESKNEIFGYTQFKEDQLWRRSDKAGIDIIAFRNDSITITDRYFEDIFISQVALGNNGETFLGTFGQGLYVIPNLSIKNHSANIPLKNLQSIVAEGSDAVYISDRQKGIFRYKDRLEKVASQKMFIPNKLFVVDTFHDTPDARFPRLFFETNRNYGALKGIFEIDSSTIIMATSQGISKRGATTVLHDSLWYLPANLPKIKDLSSKLFKTRSNATAFDIKNKLLYVASLKALQFVGVGGTVHDLTYKGSAIISNDIKLFDGMLWCATQNHGILVFKNNLLHKRIDTGSGLGNNFVVKIEFHENQLYISNKTGFQIYDFNKKHWRTIGNSEGIENGSVKDFSVGSNLLWILSNNELISRPSLRPDYKNHAIYLAIDSITINSEKVDLNKKGVLRYDQNNFRIYPNFKGLIYENETVLKYAVSGAIEREGYLPATAEYIDLGFFPPGIYKFTLQASYHDTIIKPIVYQFKINKAFWQTWWFYLIVAILLMTLSWLLLRSRNKMLQRKNEERLELQRLQTEMIDSQLKALRSQMNPHFIFNSLNSIQDLILQQDTEASYDYIVLFSNLVRNALNYSNESAITIEKEIDFLKSYLKLEKLRFGTEFHFLIEHNELKTIRVPSLIVQPFVENAIVHGLFHKQSQKKLSISFMLSDSLLYCTIIDNGVGRKKAQEIQKRQGFKHKPFALNSIHKRLEILNHKYHPSIGFEITDLHHNGNPSGTKVVITLPCLT